MSNEMPERVWMWAGGSEESALECGVLTRETRDIGDTEYIRADIAEQTINELKDRIAELKAALDKLTGL
jgi:uncharacterized protein YceH (UPF0502 family)